MPDFIDLVSSDPPAPERPRHEAPPVQRPSYQLPTRRSSHLGLFSSDSIDVSVFNDDAPDEPAKKRRRSAEKQSPLRNSTSARETTLPKRGPSILFSDDDFDLPPSNPAALKTKPGRGVEESDPIFSSSAPQPPFKSKPSDSFGKTPVPSDIIALDDSDDDFLKPQTNTTIALRGKRQDEIEEFSDPFSLPGFDDDIIAQSAGPNFNTIFSSKTAGLLSSLVASQKEGGGPSKAKSGPRARTDKGTKGNTAFDDFSDDVDEPVEPRRPAKKACKLTTEEKEAKAKARADAKAQKELDRQLEKERKQKLKEEKAKQKQLEADIAEVNKLKVDKKDSTPEMIIDLSDSLKESSVVNQAVEFMRRLGVDHNFFPSPIPNVVKWRRKKKARYNEAAGHWEPCEFHIDQEKHVLCLVPAQEFVDMVIPAPDDDERESLDLHVLKIKSAYPDSTPIYLIEGLTAWMRKNQNSRNRAFQAEVRRQYEPPNNPSNEESTTSRGRGRKTKNKPETTPPVDDDTIEDALLALQVTHSCLIHHTAAPAESAEWIKNFTEHISTVPYRRNQMEGNDSAFCMDGGQVKPGEDNHDTWVKMLQEVNRVTASIAYGIAGQYPSVTDLVRGMRMHGPNMLEDVKKSANKNGALTDSRVGPAASRRLYKVFTGLDPTSTDV